MKLLKITRLFPLVLSFIGALAMSTAPAVADDVKLKLWSGGFVKEGQRAIRCKSRHQNRLYGMGVG